MEDTRSCRILAISDFDWKFGIRQRLDLGGYGDDELRFAASGLEGLAAAEQDPPDLIIYGLFTLDLDGYEFCRRLQWIPALQNVPVLLVGWISPKIVYPQAQRAGARSGQAAGRILVGLGCAPGPSVRRASSAPRGDGAGGSRRLRGGGCGVS